MAIQANCVWLIKDDQVENEVLQVEKVWPIFSVKTDFGFSPLFFENFFNIVPLMA